MDTDSNKITWVVIIVAVVAVMGGLFIKFVPHIDSQMQAYIQVVTGNVSGVDASSNSDFSYSKLNTADDTIEITGYSGHEENLIIPTYRKIGLVYYKITSIGDSAFNKTASNKTTLTSVDIPASVKTIGDYAFDMDSNLKSLILGSGTTSIGAAAFNKTALTSVDIPDSVQTIGDYAFDNESNLRSLTLGSGVTSIGAAAFNKTALTSVDIPDSVQIIGDYAFDNDSNLKSLTLGSGVTSIGDSAFNETALTRVDFPASVKSVGDWAFAHTPLSAISFKRPVDLGHDSFTHTYLKNVTLLRGSTYITQGSDATFDSNVTVTVK